MASPGPRPDSNKRRKLDRQLLTDTAADTTVVVQSTILRSLDRPISPPPLRKRSVTPTLSPPESDHDAFKQHASASTEYLTSPIQLTHINDLPPCQNIDTTSLKDIIGSPMIKECWNFNFLFDLDFVMQHFDPDVRNLVKLKIVHGFWTRDDKRRIDLMETAERHPNVECISAYMPDPFGTHHSKLLILLRHDDLAQVVVHTANMIPRDWANMTQATWRSPLLPLQSSTTATTPCSQKALQTHSIGSGARFKVDLVRYLKAYGKRLNDLINQLVKYDFSTIRAAFIGSTPSRQNPAASNTSARTSWGWLGLQEILSKVPIRDAEASSPPNIVIQISSIATLGQTPAWLTHFQSVLGRCSPTTLPASSAASGSGTLHSFANPTLSTSPKHSSPKFNIIFSTANEIRASLDGYASGGSIHTKIASVAQKKQLEYLRPLLCHWYPSASSSNRLRDANIRKAWRGPAAPHIKTYIRFSGSEKKTIDWAMVTSANLSKQAWGDVVNKKEEIWIQSWETGIVVWPELFQRDGEDTVTMVPVFARDMPRPEDLGYAQCGSVEKGKEVAAGSQTVIGFRMPYDLPLDPYEPEEEPWCASSSHAEPDWKGQTWAGH